MVVVIFAKSPCVNGCHFDASTIMGLVKLTAQPVPRHALSGPRAGVVLFDAIFVSDGSESESNVSAAVSVPPFGIICVSADSETSLTHDVFQHWIRCPKAPTCFKSSDSNFINVTLTRKGECKPDFGSHAFGPRLSSSRS